MNWALVSNEAWDYPADAIGYDTGLAVELNQPKWTLRYALFELPSLQNSFTAEDQVLAWPYHSSAHDGPFLTRPGEWWRNLSAGTASIRHPGAIRFLAFLNRADMFSYSEAIPILKANGAGADVSAASAYRYQIRLRFELGTGNYQKSRRVFAPGLE